MGSLLPHAGLVAPCWLSCPLACGILVPRSGIKPVSPELEGRFITTRPPGESPEHFLLGTLFVAFSLYNNNENCDLVTVYEACF